METERETSSRTGSPKRRRRSSSRTASSRSAASSETSKSASRETRKNAHSTISICGKRRGRKCRIASSSGTKQPREPIGRNRGSSSGTFTRAKRSSVESGSRTKTPRLSESPEMYGNGWPVPTASGVSTGKTSAREEPLELRQLVLVELVDVRDDDSGLGERRPKLALPEPRLARRQLEHALADLGERLERRAAVRRI